VTVRKASGRALVARITADMASRNLQPDAKERELLALAEGLADQLDALRRAVKAEGPTVTLKSGRVLAHPSCALINTTSLALAKVLAQINMDVVPAVNRTKQAAAQARWRAHNEAKARWEGA
jgi:hypothetical protein